METLPIRKPHPCAIVTLGFRPEVELMETRMVTFWTPSSLNLGFRPEVELMETILLKGLQRLSPDHLRLGFRPEVELMETLEQ